MQEHKTYEIQAVNCLQRYLRQLSYQYEGITSPPVDGVFDSVTRRSLKDFQQLNGLEPSGVADRTTWDLLFRQYNESIRKNLPPEKVSIFPRNPPDFKLASGDESFYVTVLQFMLRELARDYGVSTVVELTGVYDEKTVNAVADFQKSIGVHANGETGRQTWNLIASAYNLRADEYYQ